MNSTTTVFSDLDRKEKIRVYRKRVGQMQVVKEGRKTDRAFHVARKIGKEHILERNIFFPMMYRQIASPRETAMWAQVVQDMLYDRSSNPKGARMAVLDD
jgi:hypothetical protein